MKGDDDDLRWVEIMVSANEVDRIKELDEEYRAQGSHPASHNVEVLRKEHPNGNKTYVLSPRTIVQVLRHMRLSGAKWIAPPDVKEPASYRLFENRSAIGR